MASVYVVIGCIDYSSSTVIGVFSDRDKALACAEDEIGWDSMYIEEWNPETGERVFNAETTS